MFSSARFLGAAALVAAFAAPAAVFAQTAPAMPAGAPAAGAPAAGAHHRHHGNGYMRALHSLNLSDAQKQQIKTAMQQMHPAGQTAQTMDPATRKANREKLHAQIEAILTPAQRTQLQAAMQQQRQMRQTNGTAATPGTH